VPLVKLTSSCGATVLAMSLFGACSGRAGHSSPVSAAPENAVLSLTPQTSGTTQRLQAISPVDQRVAWVSGLGGTFVRTTDGGDTWVAGVVPGAETLEFRDVHGVSPQVAYLLAAGKGSASRIYRTSDGGETWTLLFQNRIAEAFYDCFDFWSPAAGLVFSDAIRGRFPALRTADGSSWLDIGHRLPPAQPGEAAFAASGTCVVTQGESRAWIATGGAPQARVLATTDRGESWRAHPTPIVSGPSAGGFSLAFRDSRHGIVAGGDLDDPRSPNRIAVSSDGGRSWRLVSPPPFEGAVFGLSYVPGLGPHSVVATGPGGAAWSRDEGTSWEKINRAEGYWAVGIFGRQAGWLVGTGGRILKLSWNY
jgi:photosystem II stability/assembly factor-like uncharacterized protein